MSLFRSFGAKLSDANEALASARKSWRDEAQEARESTLDARQAALNERAASVELRLDELRELESRRTWRKVKAVLGMIVVGGLAFVAGFVVRGPSSEGAQAEMQLAEPATEDVGPVAAPTPPEARTAVAKGPPGFSDPDEAAQRGKYGVGDNFNVGHYCLDKEKQGDVTFDECLQAAAIAIGAR